MTVGLTLFDLHLPGGRSLKDKRMVLSRLKGRLRSRFNVAVAEVDHQDLWQRAALAVVCVAAATAPVEETLRAVGELIEREVPGSVLDAHTELLT